MKVGSLVREGKTARFDLELHDETIPIFFTGETLLPDAFKEGARARVDGKWKNGILKSDRKAIELGRLSLMANFLLISLAFLVLLTQLLRSDYSNYYVAMHSSEHLSLFYQLTAVFFGDAQPFREFQPAAAAGRGIR